MCSSPLPPSTNRGVTITLHWLSITFFINPAKAMRHFLDTFFDYGLEGDFDWSPHFTALHHGARGYEALFIGPSGIRLYAYPSTGKHCHLEVPGEVIEQVGMETTLYYLRSLNEQDFEWRASRIDIAFDNAPFTPRECYDAWTQRNVRTKAHEKSHKWYENAEGTTFYVGSRQSGRLIRVYDRRGPTRLEIEFKKDWAAQVVANIAQSNNAQWAQDCIGYLRDYIDFVDTQSNTGNISRALLLSWWSDFIGDAERLRIEKTAKSEGNLLVKYRGYLDRLLPTLYLMKHGLGVSLDDIVEMAESRLTERHMAKLKRIQDLANNK